MRNEGDEPKNAVCGIEDVVLVVDGSTARVGESEETGPLQRYLERELVGFSDASSDDPGRDERQVAIEQNI